MRIGWIRYPQKLYESGRVTRGGSETANQYVIDYLRKNGHEVLDFMPEANERINLIDLPAIGTPLMFQDLVKKIDKMNSCDIIVTTNWFGAILPELKVPLMTVFHSNASMMIDSLRESNITDKEVLNKWLGVAKKYELAQPSAQQDHEKVISLGEKYFATKSNKIIAVSGLLKESLVKFYQADLDKIIIIHNAYDPVWLDINPDNSGSAIKIINLTRLPDDYNGFVGKGADRILEVFSQIDVPKVLVASGKPAAYREIISRYIENMRLVENADRKTVSSELAGAHISIHCSRCEACQMTLIESMLMKTVPISFKVGVAAELIEHGKNGFLVEDTKQMVDCINQLIKDRTRLEEMATAAREKILDEYSAKKVGEQYERVLEEMICQK